MFKFINLGNADLEKSFPDDKELKQEIDQSLPLNKKQVEDNLFDIVEAFFKPTDPNPTWKLSREKL